MPGWNRRNARLMDRVRHGLRASYVVLLLVGTGCASTPESSRERDEEAKRFEPVTRDSVIYVYRPDRSDSSGAATLWASGILVGESLPGTYFRVIVFPGRTLLHVSGPDAGSIEVNTRGNDVVYVEMQTLIEDSPHSYFRLRPAPEAQAAIVQCCKRLEVWRPGQPRLLW